MNNKTDNLEDFRVVYTVDTKKESAAPNTPAVENPLLHLTDSKIRIADALELVKQYYASLMPEDVYKHFGYGERPMDEDGLREHVRYS